MSESPAVYFIEDLCRELGMSRSTLKRLRARGAFPMAPLPVPGRPRWSVAVVQRFLAAEGQSGLPRKPWRRIA